MRIRNPYFVTNASQWDGVGAYEFQSWGPSISGEIISAADRDALWADVWAAMWEMDGQSIRTDVRGVLDARLLERLDTELRAVLHRVFVPHVEQNQPLHQPQQTEEGWASGFHVARMITEGEEYVDSGTTIRVAAFWFYCPVLCHQTCAACHIYKPNVKSRACCVINLFTSPQKSSSTTPSRVQTGSVLSILCSRAARGGPRGRGGPAGPVESACRVRAAGAAPAPAAD
jgi:hypothetical protein